MLGLCSGGGNPQVSGIARLPGVSDKPECDRVRVSAAAGAEVAPHTTP